MFKDKSNQPKASDRKTQNSYESLVVALSLVLILFLLLLFKSDLGALVSSHLKSSPRLRSSQLLKLKDRSKIKIIVDELPLLVEVVNTQQSRSQGLSNRPEIGSDGMLFVFPETKRHSFWMNQMNFGLDFIWINQGKVVAITNDAPAPSPNMNQGELPIYQPDQKVDMVLEVNDNFLENNQIDIGDIVKRQSS